MHQLPQHHDHDNRRRQVVQDRRQEEGHEGHTPHQLPLRTRLNRVTHKVETAIGVDNLHDGHRSHQEEQCAGGIAQMMLDHLSDVMDDIALGHSRIIGSGPHHEQGPAQHTHQQRNGCLVHSCQAFQGYTQIANAEDTHNQNR